MSELQGSDKYYRSIAKLLWIGFLTLAVSLIVLHMRPVRGWLEEVLGQWPVLFVQLAVWGSAGGLIAAYKYLANDKDANEVEAAKAKADPALLRYPNEIDVHLYGLRILSSGVLGAVSGLLVITGLVYFQVDMTAFPLRQKLFMVLLAFVVGLQENDFLGFLATLHGKLVRAGKAKSDATKY